MGGALVEIGVVARTLGVAPSTLRTWERRYNVVVPQRGDHGERLYTSEQIALLQRVLSELRRGARAHAAHKVAAVPLPVRTVRFDLAPAPEAPVKARRAVDALIAERGSVRFGFFLRLVASELVNNAVLYGSDREPIVMELTLYRDRVELQVQNAGGRLRMRNLRTRRRQGGRGLEIVDALADAWSIDSGPFGTTIRVRLRLEPGQAPD